MSDNTQPPDKQKDDPVRITLELPTGLVGAYDELVESGIYPDRSSALVHAIIESWRHNNGSFHTVRVDVRREASRDGESDQAPNEPEDASEG